jgi:hypothetical protein
VWRESEIVRPKTAEDTVLLSFFRILRDPSHPEHDDISEWVGEDFAPEYFEADEVNRKLKRRKKH